MFDLAHTNDLFFELERPFPKDADPDLYEESEGHDSEQGDEE